jgi:class 3 adenylate cyclase
MVDLKSFLNGLGLPQYAQTFADNDIDGLALLELEDAHLKELGVSLGHRLRLIKAIAELRAAGAAMPEPASEKSSASTPVTPGTHTSDVRGPADGERRQLTLMFADLVGSTELAARADPEDVREVMRAYQDICAGMIARYDGYLAKFLGDGVLAYFGYPHAHEDAAERAVRAARGIVDAITRLAPRGAHRLQVRIGIATGMVVVGANAAPDGASELAAIGDTPNLAARLQSLAEPNAIIIADSTRALTRGAFRYADLGLRHLKGIPNPVRVWHVVGESTASRFEAAHTVGLSRFVGRDHEVALLHSRWEQAVSGEGQTVLLCGEGGIGKSRIAEQLRQRLQDSDHIRVRYQCSPFHVSSPLQPAIAQLEYAANLTAEDDDATKLTKLEVLLRPTSADMAETVPLIAGLLGIPIAGRYEAPQLTSDMLKRRTLEALAGQMIALAKIKPVYWLIEDVHWVDPTTRELIGLCLDRIRDLRVFILVTFRPEFVPAWGHMPHVTGLALNRLARRQCTELVESLSGGKSLPAEVLDQIVSKTDGIPLFIEELTKTVLAAGLMTERDGRYVLTGPLPPMAIPATLHDSLMARLERLSPVKEVAQIGSVIGREFSYELLAAVAQGDTTQLKDALNQLAKAELVFVRGEPPEATYVFKHALVQDAAYASLLRARRQQLHAGVAQALQDKYPDLAARSPELLAHHYEAAGFEERGKEYWSRAGRLALTKSTYAEATSHLARALALVAKAPPSATRAREESALLVDRCVAMSVLRGPGSPEHGAVAAEAVKVSASLGDDALHFRACWADWMFNSIGGNLPAGLERANGLVGMANRIGADDLLLQAHHARWTTAFLRGQVLTTRDDIERGLALYDLERHRDHWSMYGAHDPGVCARGTGACVLWQAGLAERADQVAKDAIRVGNELGHPFSRAIGYFYSGFLAIMAGDADVAHRHAEATAAVAAEGNMAWPAGLASFMSGWVLTRRDALGRGVDQMERTFRKLQDTKQRAYLTFLGSLLAGAKLEMGRAEDALNFLDELQQLSVETHQQLFLSEFHRLRAAALQKLDPKSDRIEDEYRTAIRVAREQGALALELRAATGLASRWMQDGRADQAATLVRPVFEQFQEGLATPDLRAAKTLLDSHA